MDVVLSWANSQLTRQEAPLLASSAAVTVKVSPSEVSTAALSGMNFEAAMRLFRVANVPPVTVAETDLAEVLSGLL